MPFELSSSLVFLISTILQTGIGFGGGILCIAVFPYMTDDFLQAALLLQLVYVVYTGYLVFKLKGKIRFDILLPIQIPTLIFTAVFTFLSVGSIDSSVLNILFGIAMVSVSCFFLIFSDSLHFKPSLPMGLLMGVLTGLCNGLFAVAGPPAVLYLAPSIEDKDEYLRTMQYFFFCSNLISLPIRLSHAQISRPLVNAVLLGWTAVFIGSYIGMKISGKLKGNVIKKLVYGFIGLDGIWMIVSQLIAR